VWRRTLAALALALAAAHTYKNARSPLSKADRARIATFLWASASHISPPPHSPPSNRNVRTARNAFHLNSRRSDSFRCIHPHPPAQDTRGDEGWRGRGGRAGRGQHHAGKGHHHHHAGRGGGQQQVPLCKFYQQGNCTHGAACRFRHDGWAEQHQLEGGGQGYGHQGGSHKKRVAGGGAPGSPTVVIQLHKALRHTVSAPLEPQYAETAVAGAASADPALFRP